MCSIGKYFKNLKEYRNAIAHSKDMNNIIRKDGEVAVEWLLQALDSDKQSQIETEEELIPIEENELYLRFKEEIENLVDDINIDPKKYYIAFKIKKRNFLTLWMYPLTFLQKPRRAQRAKLRVVGCSR